MKLYRLTGAALLVCAAALAGTGPAPADAELVARLMSFFGISATPSQMKAPDAPMTGDIWIADAGGNTRAPLTRDGAYSWPVFDPGGEIAVLSLADGRLTAMAYDPRSSEAGTYLAHLRGEERAYGDAVLYVRQETRNEVTGDVLEWNDVFVKEGDKRPRNISQCEGANCRQPSLSADGGRIAYVRASRN
jgi:hypothetical protein